MKNHSHICLDLDGTTLALKNDITDFCTKVLTEVNKEVQVVLVSARIPSGMRYLQEKIEALDNPIVCYNGAYVIHNDKVIYDLAIDYDAVEKINSWCKPLGIQLGIYSYNQWFVPEDSLRVQKEISNTKTQPVFEDTDTTLAYLKAKNQGIHKLMLMGIKETADQIEEQLSELTDLTTAYRSNDTLIEIAPFGINKMLAIKKIIGDDLTQVIAFGDNYNDIDMIREVGLGVAVDNAREALKEIADRHTHSCVNDGVAHFLNDYFDLKV